MCFKTSLQVFFQAQPRAGGATKYSFKRCQIRELLEKSCDLDEVAVRRHLIRQMLEEANANEPLDATRQLGQLCLASQNTFRLIFNGKRIHRRYIERDFDDAVDRCNKSATHVLAGVGFDVLMLLHGLLERIAKRGVQSLAMQSQSHVEAVLRTNNLLYQHLYKERDLGYDQRKSRFGEMYIQIHSATVLHRSAQSLCSLLNVVHVIHALQNRVQLFADLRANGDNLLVVVSSEGRDGASRGGISLKFLHAAEMPRVLAQVFKGAQI